MLTVVKAGGAWMDGDPPAGELRALAALGGHVVVVHGGGKEISQWQERAGLPVEWADGLRVTRGDALPISAMVLSGWMNKRLVRHITACDRAAVGISGEDGGLLSAIAIDPARYGAVGRIVAVEPAPLRALLAGGFLPVVSPVSAGPDGPLNVNADVVAVELALALGADRLLLVSDVDGVCAGGGVLASLDPAGAASLVAAGAIGGGMAVKVSEGLRAAHAGIEVRIGNGALLRLESGERGTGTVLVSSRPAAAVA